MTQFNVSFETVTTKSEHALAFDKPVSEIMDVIEQLPCMVTRIVIPPDAVERLTSSKELETHVGTMEGVPNVHDVELSFGVKDGKFGYTLNQRFSDAIPGLPPIAVEAPAT